MHEKQLVQPELIADYACETGENPLWHPAEKRLYWTDIPTGRLFRFDPASRSHEEIYRGRPVGGFTFEADGGLLLFRDRGNVVHWRDGELTAIIEDIPEERDSRFNDVIADPSGRVFCGTLSSQRSNGHLYRLDVNGKITRIIDNIQCSNGMGFSPSLKGFYYTDSYAREIYCFKYDVAHGALSKRRIFARTAESDGFPDGLTVDQEGCVWSALWDGSGLIRFDSSGTIKARMTLPTRKVSSMAFGGDDMHDLYVTTAGGHTRQEDGPTAGALFRIRVKAVGRPEFFSRIGTQNIRL